MAWSSNGAGGSRGRAWRNCLDLEQYILKGLSSLVDEEFASDDSTAPGVELAPALAPQRKEVNRDPLPLAQRPYLTRKQGEKMPDPIPF